MAAILASVDGAIGLPETAVVSVTDEGLLRGDGVFEVIRVYAGRPFALPDHIERMRGSAANLRLDVDFDVLEDEIAALLDAAGTLDAALRLVVTRGGRRIALIEELAAIPPTLRVATVVYAPTRILDGIKSLSYAANMLSTRLAVERGADEALLVTPHGRVLEGSRMAFFYVLGDGVLSTPPLTDHILDSITRRHLMAAVEVRERSLATDELGAVTEAFLASTIREVHPITAIDDLTLSHAPGPVSAAAATAIRAHIDAQLASTPVDA